MATRRSHCSDNSVYVLSVGPMIQAAVRSCQAHSQIELVLLWNVINKVSEECGGCLAALGHSGNPLCLWLPVGKIQGVWVYTAHWRCACLLCACYRWTPRGRASWSWTAYRGRSSSLTVRCTWPCSPSSSRNSQVIGSNPQAKERDLKCLSLLAASIWDIMSSWWCVSVCVYINTFSWMVWLKNKTV